MQRTAVTWILGVVAAVSLLGWSPAVPADRVSDLETRMLQLEKQNAELQAQIQALLSDVRQQKETVQEIQEVKPAAPATEFWANTKIGGDWRMRGEMWDNIWNFDHKSGLYDDSWEYYRMRTRLWADTKLQEDLRFYFKMTNEYKWGLNRKANTLLIDPDYDSLLGNKQLFLDNAFLEWTGPLDIDYLTLKIGRQDLMYGEGFLIMDGLDNVGSMTFGFDAIKTIWVLGEKTNLDVFAAKVQENEKNFADDEDFFAAYLTDTSVFENHKLEAYALHRNKNNVDDYFAAITPAGDPKRGTVLDPERRTTALGGRVSGSFLDKNLTYAAEGAYQFGKIQDPMGAFFSPDEIGQGDIDRRAYGGYAWGQYTWNDVNWKPYAKLGGTFTSGDDPDTEDYEGFDTFYGEWPKYSDMLIYQLYDPFYPLKGGCDPDLGAWTNMIIAQAEVGAKPTEEMGASLTYMHLWADEDTGLGDGSDRGDMVKGMLSYNFNKYLSSYILGEYFWPEDYYPDDSDEAFFGRWEMMLKF